jgi:hypothetical protein
LLPEFIIPFERDASAFLPAMALSFALSLITCLIYRYTHKDSGYDPYFHVALIGSSMCVTMIMMALWNAMWLSIGLIGTIAIVRFRARIREPRDIFYLFLGMGLGVLCSTGDYLLAVLCAGLMYAALLGLHFWQYDRADIPDYTLTFHVKSPKAAEAFALAAPNLFGQVALRSTAQIAPDCFEYVYAVQARKPAKNAPATPVEDAILGLRQAVEGISCISLVKPESLVDI